MFKTIKNLLIVFAAASFPIVFIYNHNYGYLQFSDIYIVALIIIFTFILVWLVSWSVLDNQEQAMITTVFFILYFFCYDFIFVKSYSFPAPINKLIIPASFAFFPLLYIVIVFIRGIWLAKLSVFTIIMVVTLLGFNGWQLLNKNSRASEELFNVNLDIELCRSETIKPDIYYLVLDAYGREDILNKFYNLDNSNFIQFLKDNNFYIASNSYTNYPRTLLSLSSTLNLDYHKNFNFSPRDNSVLISNLSENKIMKFLKDCGYETYSFATGYPGTEMRKSDYYLSPKFVLNDFHHQFINMTPFFIVPNKALFYSIFDSQRKRVLYSFANLPKIADHNPDRPKYVISHITSPHEPFVFDQNGQMFSNEFVYNLMVIKSYSDNQSLQQDYIKYYGNQLLFISDLTKKTLTELKEKINRPSIIIVQSDHGPASSYVFLTDQLTPEYLYERFSILNAYYFYDGNYSSLYDSISPVNTFRLILNQYLGQDLSLLEDRLIYANDLSDYVDIDKETFIHLAE